MRLRVGVVVGVDQVPHLVAHAVGGGYLVDRSLQVVPNGGWCIERTTPSEVVRKAAW